MRSIDSINKNPNRESIQRAYNNTSAPTLAGIAIEEAVKRAGIAPEQVDDVIMGAALKEPQGNIGRMAALAGGLPTTVSGMSIDRQCSSGMMAIATAAKQIQSDGMDIVIGGGVESISLVQNEHMNTHG